VGEIVRVLAGEVEEWFEEEDDRWDRPVCRREKKRKERGGERGYGLLLGWLAGLLPWAGPNAALLLFFFASFYFPISVL
jgi:hypothetical protein